MQRCWKACGPWPQTGNAVKPPARIEFLDRKSYRQRRYRDAARVLPLFAVVLMFLPLMWAGGDAEQSRTSGGFIYLFALWIVLILIAAALSAVLRPTDAETDTEGAER